MSLPRLVVAAPSSGSGKTTVATGLMAALSARALRVSPHKVGPDYIDPGYHALATGRPGRNLDPVLVGESRVAPLLLHGASGADVAVVEGVMGLYDGRGSSQEGSTAHVAALLRAPVVLVVDAASMSHSVAALVHGFATYGGVDGVHLAGVVLNRVGSDRHEALLREALEGRTRVLGVLRRDDDVRTPSRHLGLVPAAERAPEAVATVRRLGELCARALDLDGLLELARSAPALDAEPWTPAPVPSSTAAGPRPVVAVAGGPAFTFSYAETAELLTAAGAEVVVVDPLRDERLPAGTAGLVLGGGFPEVFAEQLSANAGLRDDVARLARSGAPVSAECAGLLYLCERLDGLPMAGVLPASATMTPRLTLGYREARAASASWLGDGPVAGHEFHRTAVEPRAGAAPAWSLQQHSAGGRTDRWAEGWVQDGVHASYLHLHWAGLPGVADRFVRAARSLRVAA
ncbi:MAG: Cobyrinic acid a,c-diamide synthetase [uncultured Frankineae bacterium]|uniref:Hydrogenobyrinate a,c-diamide synthase n=1 Tax=uncultured Frankineae bacterium TaxID=437475 RepID=A0A6J4L1Q6_9ACTN|nr:MAG: Cobyrinic acid a,c-diamide synthetase [uncultured Frankineae bacterium]